MSADLARQWAGQFGLAIVPLFESDEPDAPESHHVLLDGGFGSFAMSVAERPLWHDRATAAWAWSSNLHHHVTVTDKVVAVRRWDRLSAEEFSRASVDARIEPFYEYLTSDRVRSSLRVVDHVLHLFRRMRSLLADARIADERSIEAFLSFLDTLIHRERASEDLDATGPLADGPGAALLRALPQAGLNSLMEDVDAP